MKRTLFAAAAATLALGTASVYAADADAPQPSVYFDQQVSTNADRNADRNAERANDATQTHRQSATAGSSASARNGADADAGATLNDSFNYPY
jgi:hypothetical protein